jgi:hypothetical protein
MKRNPGKRVAQQQQFSFSPIFHLEMPVEARIPGSTRVLESRVIPASIDRVWETVRPLQFKWLKTVKEAKVQEGKDAEGTTD